MPYVNLASATKLHRASQIITDIGSDGLMKLYTGASPASPDISATGTLLVTLALSATPGVASLAVADAVITAGGTSGVDGSYALTFSMGGGTGAAGIYSVSGGTLASVQISDPGGGYTSAPTISGFATAGLSGALATPVMTGIITFNAIASATAVNTGVAGYARITRTGGTPIIDLDVGTTNSYSVVISNILIGSGGSVSCTANMLIEA